MLNNKLLYSLLILTACSQAEAISVRALLRSAFAAARKMTSNKKFAVAAVCVVGGCCLKKKYKDYKVAQARLLEKRLLEKHKPEKRFTYGAVGEDITEAEAKQKMEPEYELACMLAGFKDIYLGDLADKRAFTRLSGFTELCRMKNIKELQARGRDSVRYILYTSRGKKNALLLKKSIEEKVRNYYIDGYLLGYREKNIEIFYERINKRFFAQEPEFQVSFEEDRKKTKDWLEQQGVAFSPAQ